MSNSISGVFAVVSDVTRKEGKSPTKVRMVNEATRSEEPDDKLWVNAVFWDDKLGKVVEQYFAKGNRVFIEGCLEPRKYKEKLYLDLNVSRFDFIGGGAPSEDTPTPKASKTKTKAKKADVDNDDDIPF